MTIRREKDDINLIQTVADNMMRARMRLKMSKLDAANALGVKAGTIDNLESGQTMLSFLMMMKLARIYALETPRWTMEDVI